MLFPVSREAFLPLLLLSFLAGGLLAAVYDLLRIRRVAFRLPTGRADGVEGKGGGGFFGALRRNLKRTDTLLCFFEDIAFCLFGTVVLILMDFKLHYGIPRWYSYAAVVGGFALWRVTLGRLIMSCSEAIVRFLLRMARWIKRRLLLPALRLLKRGAHGLWCRWKKRRARQYTEAEEKRILAVLAAVSDEDTNQERT